LGGDDHLTAIIDGSCHGPRIVQAILPVNAQAVRKRRPAEGFVLGPGSCYGQTIDWSSGEPGTARPARAERLSLRPAVNTVNTAASSSGTDREPSRFAAASTVPRHSGFPDILTDPGALRSGTVRGPGSLKQPRKMKGTL
jgi:hypothetical protein